MTEKFLRCKTGITVLEEWHKAAKQKKWNEYKVQYPQGVTETRQNYTDRITGIIEDTLVKLARDGVTLHSDRIIGIITNPTDANDMMVKFDSDKEGDKLNVAYYTPQAWRDDNSVGVAFTIIDRAAAEAAGFVDF